MKGKPMTDPDENDAYSGYRPDMDQHQEPLPQMEWHWWMWPAIFGGTAIWILFGIWLFT
jgi:hypothetical protein